MRIPKRSKRVGDLGMTLIEVLVALAIVAIALAAASNAAGALTSSTQRQADVLLAQLCAENELVKLRLSRLYPGAGDQSFACEQGGRKFGGTLSIAPTPNPNFRRIDAKVRDSDEPQALQVVRISTILARY